jgi:hypothetical protein
MTDRKALLVVLATLLAALLAACSGEPDGSGVATLRGAAAGGATDGTTVSDEDFEDALLQYTRCMRKEGIDMPDPEKDGGAFVIGGSIEVEGGGSSEGGEEGEMVAAAPAAGAPVSGASMEEFEAADRECSHLLPESATLSPEEEAELQDNMLKFARCMREHGVDMPDPADGVGMSLSLEDIDDPVFEKAQKACGDIIPGFGATTVEER